MDDGLTDDMLPTTGAAWYEDRTSFLDDAEQLRFSLRSALETAEAMCSSPYWDESYKVRASRIPREELQGLVRRASELSEAAYALSERARTTWARDPRDAR